jgi:hypothetical protein
MGLRPYSDQCAGGAPAANATLVHELELSGYDSGGISAVREPRNAASALDALSSHADTLLQRRGAAADRAPRSRATGVPACDAASGGARKGRVLSEADGGWSTTREVLSVVS